MTKIITKNEKPKVKVEACLNTNQPPGLDVTQYNIYVYDEKDNEIDQLWEGDKLDFQVYDYVEELKKIYTVTNFKWLDLKGNEMKV